MALFILLAAGGVLHLPALAWLLAAHPAAIFGADPGYLPRILPASASVAALLTAVLARRALPRSIPSWILAAALCCASTVFSRPVLVAVARPLEDAINEAHWWLQWVLVALCVALLVSLGIIAAQATRRLRWSRSPATAGACVALALAGWAAWGASPELATLLCYPSLALLLFGVGRLAGARTT